MFNMVSALTIFFKILVNNERENSVWSRILYFSNLDEILDKLTHMFFR